MRNVPDICVKDCADANIVFEQNRRRVCFYNPNRQICKCVQVDGCAITEGIRCDNMLTSHDERCEYFVELKGTDVKHAIEQLRVSIQTLGEFTDDRSAYVVSTNVAPALTTTIQRAKRDFRTKLQAELIIKEKQADIRLNKRD